MSENMAQGAITEVANYLFGCKEHPSRHLPTQS